MSPNGEEMALAVMEDDGWGSAITTTDEERHEAKARKLGGVPPEDHMVSMAELKELWAELKARGELWNGMTNHYLAERYGDRLYHVRGGGWFVAWQWPTGKTFGELSPADRLIASRRAARQFQDELERAAPAIAKVLFSTETEQEGK